MERDLEEVLDIYALFYYYNALYFDDSLVNCTVSWSSFPRTSCAGTCHYLQEGGCEILLSEPSLKFCSNADLKNTLLHEMIHAFLWILTNNRKHCDHGSNFQSMMNTINSSSVTDPQRPPGGYNITIDHDFCEEVDRYQVHRWICESCGDLIERAANRGPSANDCIQTMGHDKSCSNLSCHWHKHKIQCSGRYRKLEDPARYKDTGRVVSKSDAENDGDKSDGPSYTTRQTKRRLQEAGMENKLDVKMPKTVTKAFQIVDHHAFAPNVSKLARTSESRKKQRYYCIEKNKSIQHKIEVTVPIPWSDHYYADEESEEEEPLVNRRTEKRKKEKQLLEDFQGRALQN